MSKKATRLSVAYGQDQGEDYSGHLTDVIFTVLDSKDQVLKRLVIDTDELPEPVRGKVLGYGANKLCTDRTSEEKDKVAKLDAMEEVWDMLCSGEWSKEREGGLGVASVAVEALAKLKGITVPAAQKALAAYPKEKRAAILANPAVVKLADAIKAEREAAEVVNLDDMVPVEG